MPALFYSAMMIMLVSLGESRLPNLPTVFLQNSAVLSQKYEVKPIKLLVFLPLIGLKKSGPLGDEESTEERLCVQSWTLVARNFTQTAPPESSVRVLGMVGAKDHCDPWIEANVEATPPSTSYSCIVLPDKCLHQGYDGIPKLNCMFEAAIAAAHSDEILIFANGDVLVMPSFTTAFLDVYKRLSNQKSSATPSLSNFLLVGQRTDTDLNLAEIPLHLTSDALVQIQTMAQNHSVLHQDFGIDYFIFPQTLYPRDFPSFLVGRFRWDNSLLASFLTMGAKVIDMTQTIPMIHLGINPADTEAHIKRKGADYNDRLAHDHYGNLYMLGRISNAEYRHLADAQHGTQQSFDLVQQDARTDAQYLRALQRAAYSSAPVEAANRTSPRPFLLLVTISSVTEIIWAKKWIAASSLGSPTSSDPLRHFIFLTHVKEVYDALEALDPGCAMLQSVDPYGTPSPSLAWLMFWKLLTYKVSVAIADVKDLSMVVAGDHVFQKHWPDECDVLVKGGTSDWDVVAVRSRRTGNSGLNFLEAFRDCHSGQRRARLREENPKRFGSAPQNKTMTKAECLLHLKAWSIDVSDLANRYINTGGDENDDEYVRICHAIEAPEEASMASRALKAASVPYDRIKQALAHGELIDDTLHMVLTVSNAAGYVRRYELAREFISRIEQNDGSHVALYVVELAYGNQTHGIAQANNPRHLQLRTPVALWHKENLINLGVERLLPKNWKALAWIDAEIEFESPTWALDTLRLLGTGAYDLVQLFSHGIDLDAGGRTTTVYTGFGHNYLRKIPYQKKGVDMWHPGYAWACTRAAYERFGGLFEGNILGGSDQSTAYAILGMHATLPDTLKMFPSPGYKKAILEWEKKFHGLRPGYVPGVVKHHFHGSVQNRRYWERRDLLSDSAFDPQVYLQRDQQTGVIVPTKDFPKALAGRILEYFESRKEDEDEDGEGHVDGRSTFPTMTNPLSILRKSQPVDTCLHLLVLIYPAPVGGDALVNKAYHIVVADYLQRLASTYTAPTVELYFVEMAHGGRRRFRHTSRTNPRHLQVHLPVQGFWSKGNVLNLAMDQLLPTTWRAMGHVDVGTEFDSLTWPQDTLRLLSRDAFDAVQLFSHAVHMNAGGNTTRIWTGFGYNHARGLPFELDTSSSDFWYPGLAWAYARRTLDGAGGRFFEDDIAGQFDDIQAWSLLAAFNMTELREKIAPHASEAQQRSIADYATRWRSANARVGHVPGVVRQIDALALPCAERDSGAFSFMDSRLKHLGFDPTQDLHRNGDGVIYPSLTVANDVIANKL